jgi:hypothetical protein
MISRAATPKKTKAPPFGAAQCLSVRVHASVAFHGFVAFHASHSSKMRSKRASSMNSMPRRIPVPIRPTTMPTRMKTQVEASALACTAVLSDAR